MCVGGLNSLQGFSLHWFRFPFLLIMLNGRAIIFCWWDPGSVVISPDNTMFYVNPYVLFFSKSIPANHRKTSSMISMQATNYKHKKPIFSDTDVWSDNFSTALTVSNLSSSISVMDCKESVQRVYESMTAENWGHWMDRQLCLSAFHQVQTHVFI